VKVNSLKYFFNIIIFGFIIYGCGNVPFNEDSGVITINKIPEFITHDFVNLDMIEKISKFRSGYGHDFSDGFEHNCSMKHYYAYYSKYSGDDQTIPVYSPVNGLVIAKWNEGENTGRKNDYQIHIVPDNHTYITIRIFHINATVNKGDRVKSGDKIGWVQASPTTQEKNNGILGDTDFDIGVEARTFTGVHYISYFSIMADTLFENYKKRGAESRNDFIISKTWRDAHPVDWENPSPSNWFTLSVIP